MADLGIIESELRGISDVTLRRILTRVVRLIVPDTRFGHPTGKANDPMKNMGGGFFAATTPALADTEFSIAHNFGRVPYLAIPVLPLDQVGARVVDLTVTRGADDKRIYLSSSVTDAPVILAVEG